MRVKAADAVTYVFLVLAAIALAVDTGMKSSPELKAKMPDFMNGQVWGFAPLALLILAGLLIVAKHWPWKKGAEPAVPPRVARVFWRRLLEILTPWRR